MTIEFECKKCRKGYRVKDDFAGKRLRCKQCQAAIEVPQADPWDVEADFEDYEEELPVQPKRTKKRKKRSRDSIPIAMIIAMSLLGFLVALEILRILAGLLAGDLMTIPRIFGVIFWGLIINSLRLGNNKVRIGTIILACLAMFFVLMSVATLESHNPHRLELILNAVVVFGTLIPTTVALSLKQSRDYCSK